ncbi:MAG: ABC-2 family transporter protein [Nanoarchaeota archaeon]|nr:ABC-2 family transporter protein [Nanoarchaeota archaeon]
MNRYLRLWMKTFALAVSEDFAYRWNFIVKCVALILVDLIGPLVAVLIYTTSSGIPGWSLEQFILFTGTITLVLGIAHAMMFDVPWRTIETIRQGEFDRYMVKPFNPLVYLTLSAWDLEGFAEVIAGLMMIVWALVKLWAGITLGHFMMYLFLLLAGCLFIYSCMVLIAATAFLVVKSLGLFDLFFEITKFARYPMDVFGVSTRMIFTFFFPLAIAAHYPTTALLQGISGIMVLKIIIPVAVFFVLTLLAWKLAMRKYSSAGG